jgi:hypothetical protein
MRDAFARRRVAKCLRDVAKLRIFFLRTGAAV